jgi:hypothetical protein
VTRLAAAMVMLVVVQSAALAASYQLNDRVQAYVSGDWYDGTIIGLGEGDYAGEYYVDFDKFTSSSYVREDYLRPLAQGTPVGPTGPNVSTKFTPGIYECLYADQYFMLQLSGDLTYRQTAPEADPGNYTIEDSLITFTTGPYSVGQWTAEVHNAVDRAGVLLHADKDYECRAAR